MLDGLQLNPPGTGFALEMYRAHTPSHISPNDDLWVPRAGCPNLYHYGIGVTPMCNPHPRLQNLHSSWGHISRLPWCLLGKKFSSGVHVGREISAIDWAIRSLPLSPQASSIWLFGQKSFPRLNAICDTLLDHSRGRAVWLIALCHCIPGSKAPSWFKAANTPTCSYLKSIISGSNMSSNIVVIFYWLFFPINKYECFHTQVSVAATRLKYLAVKIEDSLRSVVDINSALQ